VASEGVLGVGGGLEQPKLGEGLDSSTVVLVGPKSQTGGCWPDGYLILVEDPGCFEGEGADKPGMSCPPLSIDRSMGR
jgi:hypothetical protein